MDTQDNKIDIFALTDSHQEARKLCSLFGAMLQNAQPKGKNTLICDCGDLFKGIYDRDLCVQSYLKLRRMLPEAKMVFAVGNNDFGFNQEQFKFLCHTAEEFHQANIHVLCANLYEDKSGKYPQWVDPYIILEINRKKIFVTAFCINYVKLQKYGLNLIDIPTAFLRLRDTISHIAPDAVIVLNHALEQSSLALSEAANQAGIKIDLILGGHEHSLVADDSVRHIYYPQAFSRSMLHLSLEFARPNNKLQKIAEISSKNLPLPDCFADEIEDFENRTGLNTPIAASTLDLPRNYSAPCPLGSFIADLMQAAGHADIGLISTGYITHALRYEEGKILTSYNIERAFSADAPLQTAAIPPAKLIDVFNNALRNRYLQKTGNTRFLQCSHNVGIICYHDENNYGKVRQIFINGEPLLDENGNILHPDEMILCATDTFIASGELGFDAFRAYPKETLMRNNQLIKIKDLFIEALKNAVKKYPAGSTYPYFKLLDEQ